jgi:Cu/Ag efflux protein CusF
MKPILLAAALALAAPAPAGAQQLKDGAIAVNEIEAVVTVVRVDQEARTVTIRGPKGGVHKLKVPPEAQNFGKVKQGDRFKMKYVEALAVGIRQGGAPADTEVRDVKVAPKGGTPGGMVVRTQQRAVVIDSIDYSSRYVAVRGPAGSMALKVGDDVPLEGLTAGDRVSVTFIEALAVEMVPQPKAPAKKAAPAAKKKG